MMNNLKKHPIWNIELTDKKAYLILAVYTITLLFFCSMMSPLYPINIWSDINLYFNMGKGMMHGMTLYTDVFDHKGPLIFIIYGVGYLMANTSFFGVFLIQIAAWMTMIFFTYRIAKLFLSVGYSFLVALAFPILLLEHTLYGGSAEEFVILAMVVSLFYFIVFFKDNTPTHNPRYMLVHGCMSAIVFFIKLNLVVFWGFPLLAIFIHLLVSKQYRNCIQNIGSYLLGVVIITVPIYLYFLINNGLAEAYNVYIELNSKYARLDNIGDIVSRLIIRFYQRLRFTPIGFSIILLGSIYFPIKYLKNKIGTVAFICSFLSLFIVILMLSNYVYYYSIPYYIYIITGCIAIASYLQRYVSIKFVWHMCILFAFIATGIGIHYKHLFGYSPDVLLRRVEAKSMINQFSEAIKQTTHPTLLCLGLDQSMALFTQCNIIPNVRYFVAPNLQYNEYPQLRDEQTKYIENQLTDYIVLASGGIYGEYFKEHPALCNNYILIDTFIESQDNKQYYLFKKLQ